MLSPANVLVTGSNRGIGLELVKQLTVLPTPPKNVFAACRSPDSAKDLQELTKQCKNVTIVRIDLDDLSTLNEAVQKVEQLAPNGLNLLINNAGVGAFENLDDVTPEVMMSLFKVNAVGPLMVVKAFLPLLRKASKDTLDINTSAIVNISTAFLPLLQKASKNTLDINTSALVNISTGVASIVENDTGGGYAYRTSKAALNMITKNLSLDLRKDNILVNALHPGWVKTELGGSGATMDVGSSVTKMLSLMADWRGESYHGKFYHYSGREMAW